MAIKTQTFTGGGGGGAGSDTLDDVTGRGATTTNAITVGGVSIGSAFSLPTSDGLANQVLQTNGSGSLSFATLDFTGGLEYKGSFNATAGTPSLATAQKGDYYKIATAGTIYGQTWDINDSLLINADMGGSITNSKIDKIDNTEPTNVLITTNNLNDLDSVTTAKTNLGLQTVASTGAYSDLSGTPSLATVATTGAYSDLSGRPTLGTASASATTDFLASTAGLDNLSDVSYTAGAGIDNYVLTYDHSSTSWGAEVVPSAPVTSVNGNTGAVTVSGDDVAADHSASNYTASNANIDGHLSGIDSKFGTLATVATTGAYGDLSGTPSLATVATTGAYSDLSGKPTLGTASASATTDFLASTAGLDNLSDVSYTAGAGIDNYVLTYDHSSTSWGAEVVPSAPVTSVNGNTGAVTVSGDDVAADHSASNYTASNANIDGHLSGIDSKFGTLGTASTSASTDFLSATGADSLGGNIDVNGHDLISSSNGDIEIAPDGTGSFIIKGNATSGSGRVVLNCEQNSHGITLKGPPHSAAASYTLTFPNTDGNVDQVLKSDGSGNLDWVDQASGGGGYTYSAITADPANAQYDYHYSCTGTFTITLPASAGADAGKEIRIKNMGTGTITVDGNSSETIDGQTTIDLDVQYSSITLIATGNSPAAWEIV